MAKLRLTISMVAVLGSAVFASAGAATLNNLLVNGSFESPNIRTNTISQFVNTDPSNAFGWLTGPNGVELRDNRNFPSGYVHLAANGQQYVELAVERNSFIYQDVFLKAGQEYTLKFAYSPRAPYGETLNRGSVSLGNWSAALSGGDASTQAPSTNINLWKYYAIALTPQQSGVQRLQFAATGTSGQYGMLFDDVSLTATPLPGAALLLGTSLAGFLAARRRAKGTNASAT